MLPEMRDGTFMSATGEGPVPERMTVRTNKRTNKRYERTIERVRVSGDVRGAADCEHNGEYHMGMIGVAVDDTPGTTCCMTDVYAPYWSRIYKDAI